MVFLVHKSALHYTDSYLHFTSEKTGSASNASKQVAGQGFKIQFYLGVKAEFFHFPVPPLL